MVEPISLQTMLTYLTLIIILVGVFNLIMTLQNTRKNQQLQLETRQARAHPQPSEPYQAYWAVGDITALTSFFHVMGGDCEIVVKNIRMTGAESEADGNFNGMNIAWPLQRTSRNGRPNNRGLCI